MQQLVVVAQAIPRWELIAAWMLRVTLVVSALVFLATGRLALGVFCILGVALAVVPSIAARPAHFIWPFEVELVLLFLVTAHASLGYLFGLYARLVLFDKMVHFTDSALIGFLAFLAVYLAHYLRSDRSHPWIDVFAILFITLGIGALWEICEFASDQLLGTHTQGSQLMGPLADTMWDLMVDGAGGIVAAVLGPLYMRHSRRSRARVTVFAEQLAARG